MEEKLLADVLSNDTHVRIDAAERLTDYFKNEANSPDTFPDFERLIGGVAGWLASSNFKLNMCAMDILIIFMQRMREKFKPHIATVLPSLREKLGDAKDQVRDQAQLVLQQLMQDVSGAPQAILDRLLEGALVHKNWRIKEQGLICLTRTLSYFGSGQVSVSKFVGPICALLGDANVQVRNCAVDTLVEIYRHVGVKVRIDLSKRGLPAPKLSMLNSKFDEVDSAGGTQNEMEDDNNSVSSSTSSNMSAASAQTAGSKPRTANGPSSRPSSVNKIAPVGTISSASVSITETDFEKAFTDVPLVNLFTPSDFEKAVNRIIEITGNSANDWDARVTALKELRSVASYESFDHQAMIAVLKNMEAPMLTSLKDLRSQVTREACVTISYLATVLRLNFSHFAEQMLPQLIALLPNSAKVMASSADVCIKFLLKNIQNHRLLQPLYVGIQAKSSITRKQCAECLCTALNSWDTPVIEKATSIVEDCISKAIQDADASTRKHIRLAFWAYHKQCPVAADKLLASFEPQVQKHLKDERKALDTSIPSGLPPPGATSSLLSSKRKPFSAMQLQKDGNAPDSDNIRKALTCIANVNPEAPASQPFVVQHTQSLPVIRLQQPTIKVKSKLPDKGSKSIEDFIEKPPASPRALKRPQSRAVMMSDRKNDLLPNRLVTPPRRPRSTNPSPVASRESSPPRGLPQRSSASLPKSTMMTIDDMKRAFTKAYNAADDDDDDNASMTSEKSTFSINSEMSVAPHLRYPNPTQNLDELSALCSNPQPTERRDGIAQLRMLLESGRELSHDDMQKVKGIFRKMFSEPQVKVFGTFLDTLAWFIEDHREYLEEFLFLMLLKLLHRQGTDMLSSVHYKLMTVLELIRKNFETEQQFSVLNRVLVDPQQPMNTKVKIAWLEYFLELLSLLDSADIKDNPETQQAVARILEMSADANLELRRNSQKAVTGLFDLNPASLSLILREIPKRQQEEANKILKAHMQLQEASNSADEGPQSPSKPLSTKNKSPLTKATTSSVKTQGLLASLKSSDIQTQAPLKSSDAQALQVSVKGSTPASHGSLKTSRTLFSSSPDLTAVSTGEGSSPSLPRYVKDGNPTSSIPLGSGSPGMSRIPMPRRPNSVTPGKAYTPQRKGHVLAGAAGGIRSASVDPEKMSEHDPARDQVPRPSSVRSHSSLRAFRTGVAGMEDIKEGSSPSNSASSSQFSFSDLTKLDYGSPDNGASSNLNAAVIEPGVVRPTDGNEVALIVSELVSASSPEMRRLALQSLLTFCREYPSKCNWNDSFASTMQSLLDLVDEKEDARTRGMALRVIREILKTQAGRMKEFSLEITLKALKGFSDSDTTVSQAAEDVFTLLAPALPNESTVDLLIPMVAKEKYPMLLGVVKFLTKVITLSTDEFLSTKLSSLVPPVVRGYCHSESSVRKASVFCLVAIHCVVGEKVREYFSKLTSSQLKLLDLYIKRHHSSSQ